MGGECSEFAVFESEYAFAGADAAGSGVKTSLMLDFHLLTSSIKPVLDALHPDGQYAMPPLGVELGIWPGEFLNQHLPWLRWWDSAGNLLLAAAERAAQEKRRAGWVAVEGGTVGGEVERIGS